LRLLLSWVRDFVAVTAGPEEIAQVLSMRGFELAGIDEAPDGAAGDAVLDLEITANRPDCLSVLGLARELAAAYELPVRQPGSSGLERSPLSRVDANADLDVEIRDPELCPRYAAAVAEVQVGPSPVWLARRLQACGVRPINNVVDLSNYVMLELGHPTHAFDLARLGGETLVIRRARAGERVTTLDAVERRLSPEMLVIADAERPQAVAGVMGGAASEVRPSTTLVALESAYFKPVSVRRTAKALGLKTEASARFERGADIAAPVPALERLVGLLARIGAGRSRGSVIDRYPSARAPLDVTLRASRIERVLGREVGLEEVVRILTALGFGLEAAQARDRVDQMVWTVRIPSWRVDVTREIDLIEEVARHVGYERLPSTFPELSRLEQGLAPRIQRQRMVRRVLVAAGFSEAITFTFIDRAAALPFAPPDAIVPIANPLSESFAVLRPSMLPGLIASLGHNRRRGRDDVRLFELGSRFSVEGGEQRAVGIAAVGAGSVPHWSGATRSLDFFDLKGVVECVCEAFGVVPRFDPAALPFFVPGRTATVTTEQDGAVVALGVVGQVQASIAAAHEVVGGDEVYAAELDLDGLTRVAASRDDVRVEPLPRHPSVVRDLSIVLDDALPAAKVRGTIWSAAPDILACVREFDRYRGKSIPEGTVSLSLRLTFRSPTRTLTDAEVQEGVGTIVGALERAHGAVLRGER
jgi:phenylalanyl-tRNA synthetase beta chain